MIQIAAPRARISCLAALAAILILGAALRLGALAQESLWADEFYSLATATAPDRAAFREGVRNQGAQPAYFFMLRYFTQFAGTGDFAVRLPSAIFGIATLPFIFLVVLFLFPGQRGVALLATALLAFSPMHLWYSQEARAYALQVMLEVAALGALARGLKPPPPQAARLNTQNSSRPQAATVWLAAAVLLVIAGLEVHNFTIFFWAAFVIVFLLARRWRVITGKEWAVLSVMMVIGAIHTFFAIIDRLFYRPFLQESFPASYDLTLWCDVLRAQVLGPLFSPLPAWMQGVGIALGGVLCLRGMWMALRHDKLGGTVMAVGWTLTLIVPTAISLVKPIIYWGQRYLVIAVPFTTVLLAANFMTLPHPARRRPARIAAAAALTLVVLLQVAYLWSYYAHHQKHLWRQVGAMLDDHDEKAPVYVIPERNAGLQARYMKTGARVKGLALDAGAVTAAMGRTADRSVFIVCYADLRGWLKQIGLRRRVQVGVFQTWRPGQDLWVHEIKTE